MKRFLFTIAVVVFTLDFSFAATIQGTIKKIDNLIVGVYLKPVGGAVNPPQANDVANWLITLSLNALGQTNPATAPVLTVVGIAGPAINEVPVEIIGGRYVYNYIMTGAVAGGINWASGSENLVLTVTFPSGGQTFNQLVKLHDYTADGGGQSGQAFFDIVINGLGYVDAAQMFYGTNATNVEGGNSFVDANAPLPLNLVSFNANRSGEKDAYLTWTTANEENTSRFNVQRSFDKNSWTEIGTVGAAGYSVDIRNYELYDANVNNGRTSRLQVYYRLKMIDQDGQYKFSPIQSVVFNNGSSTKVNEFLVYPNPASDGVQIEWDADNLNQPTSLEFYDVTGKLIHIQKVSDNTNQEYVDFAHTNIQAGLYLLRIMSGTEPIEHKQIVVGQNR